MTITPYLLYEDVDEGHHWHFSQPIADVQPQDWGATTPG